MDLQKDKFEEMLSPLETVVVLVYTEEVKPCMLQLYNDYQSDIFKSTTAAQSINECLGQGSKKVLEFLSRKYIKSLLEYFSTDGLSTFIFASLKQLSEKDLSGSGDDDKSKLALSV